MSGNVGLGTNKGSWNALKNAPAISNSTRNNSAGDYYTTSVAGTSSFTSRGKGQYFAVGDIIVFNGAVWTKNDQFSAESGFGTPANWKAAYDDHIISGSFANNTITLNQKDGGSFTIDLAGVGGSSLLYNDSTTVSASGGQNAFTLSASIDHEDKTQVFIDGVYQQKSGYSVSGTTLAFDGGVVVPQGSTVEIISFSSVSLTDSLADAKVFIGNSSSVAIAKTISGDATLANTGALTLNTSAKTTLGLNNVNNTTDANKPVSTAQQAEIDTKADIASIAVTVVSVPVGNRYFLDGVLQSNAVLQPGFVYRFDQSNSSNNGHPLRFSSDVSNSTPYTTGVTVVGTPGSAGAYTQIITTQSTPKISYYYCSIHSGMGGAATIRIIQTDGTSYLNGTTTVDAAFNQTGGAASAFSGAVKINTNGSGTSKLQVVGGIRNWNSALTLSSRLETDGLYFSGAQDVYIVSQQALNFHAGNALKMSISTLGNVRLLGALELNDVAQSIDFIQSGSINFDSNNDQTGRVLTIGSGRTGDSGGTTNVTFYESGTSTFGGNVLFNLDGDSTLSINDGGTNASQIKAGAGDELYIGANNTYALRFLNNGTNNVVFDAGSSIGIGTSSPGTKLTVKGGTSTFVHDNEPQGTASSVYRDAVFGSTQTVNTGITIFGTGQTGISFGDAASHIRGQVRYQHSSDTLELGSAGNINMSISSGGAATFSGGGVFSNSSQGKVKLIASSDEYSSLEFANASGTTQWEISKNNTHDLYFYKGGYKMILKSGGNVGIGTTSPLQLLDVQSSTASPKIMVKVNGQAGTTNPTAELILGAGPISSNDSACKIISFRTANYSSAAARSSGLKFQVTQNNGPRLALTIAETGVVSIPNGIVLDSNTTGGTPNATNVTLNAYEEGTWTPTLSVSGVSYTKQEGKYTRIGNVVHYWIDINFTATSGYIIYNLYLPFTTSFSSFYGSAAIGNAYRINLGTGGTMLGGYYSVNYIRLHSSGNSTGQLSPIATGGNMTIRMEGIYQAL